MTPITKKHPQFIFAVANAYFESKGFVEGLNTLDYQTFLDEALSHLVIRERHWLDAGGPVGKGDPTYRQLLPYTVIQQLIGDVVKFVPYRRLKQVGESRLAGKVSIGFGGHVDLVDLLTELTEAGQWSGFTRAQASTVDLKATLRKSSVQEITEEVIMTQDATGQLVDAARFIATSDQFIIANDEVGSLHVGLVQHIQMIEGYTVSCAEAELETMAPMTAAELLAGDWELEPWTRLILEAQT